MKKTIKTILIILNLILSLIFFYSFILLKNNILNLMFILSFTISIVTQIICLDKFKIGKRFLFILLNILLTFITSLLEFLITGFLVPFSSELSIFILTTIIGVSFIFINFTIFYTYLMSFINKLKEKERPKSSFVKLLIFYPLIVIILETLIMIFVNKP